MTTAPSTPDPSSAMPSSLRPSRPLHPSRQDPTVCARCARHGRTCCQLDTAGESVCFPVSAMEWERVLEALGSEQGAFVQEPNTPPFLDAMRRLFPGEDAAVEALFPSHKFHLRLATSATGQCLFLSAKGCALPREARPYYCRLFPFWFQGDRLTLFNAPGCQALREGGLRGEVLDLLGLSEPEARTLHGRLRLAWGLPPRPGMPRVAASFARNRK